MSHEGEQILPPGTVILEEREFMPAQRAEFASQSCLLIFSGDTQTDDAHINLHPVPTNDPNDPLNWSWASKVGNMILVCLYSFTVFTVLDINPVIYGQLHEELGFSFASLSNSFALNDAGLAVGPLFLIPLALKFGRRPIYILSITVSLSTVIWLARMRTMGDLYGANILSGMAGSIAETLCSMSVADLFFVHQRGMWTSASVLAANIGAFLAPVAAGYIAEARGWPWIWWSTSILLGGLLLLFIVLYEETKYSQGHTDPLVAQSLCQLNSDCPPLKDASAKQNDSSVHHCEFGSVPMERKTFWQRRPTVTTSSGGFGLYLRHCYQPFVVGFTFPSVLFVAIVYGVLLATMSVLLNVMSIYFTLPPYNFSSSGVGLLNIAIFVGALLGSGYGGPLSDYSIKVLAMRNGGCFEPEMRLWLMCPAILVTSAGYFMFGLTMAQGKTWIIPVLGLGIYGFGFAAMAGIVMTYLIDAYVEVIGDSVVFIAFMRNAIATVMVVVMTPWIDGMGPYDMFVLSGCLSFAVYCSVIPMILFGRRSRAFTATKYKDMAGRNFGYGRGSVNYSH